MTENTPLHPNGWLLINKPSGTRSTKAVSLIKRRLPRKYKVGHAGTLDNLACGLLPIAIGYATKTVDFFMGKDKTYEFTVQWGSETETDDLGGEVTHTSNFIPSLEEIQTVISGFVGTIQQTPPLYSAIKINGRRASDMARKNKDVELMPREINIYSLEILSHQKTYTTFKVLCSKGTYVRSLARDIGRKLGCFGHVTYLCRTKIGEFELKNAFLLEKIEKIGHITEELGLLPVRAVLDDIPAVSCVDGQVDFIRNGREISIDLNLPNESIVLLLDSKGKEVALGLISKNKIKPSKVFNTEH